MTTPSAEHPEFVHEDGFTGMIVDDSGKYAARETHTDHVTADGTKQRAFVSTNVEEDSLVAGLAGKIAQYTRETATDQGYRSVAICPYVKSWIEKQDDPRYEAARDTPRPEHVQ